MSLALIRSNTFCAWKGPSLPIVNTRGECGGEPLAGYYFREARFVRMLRFEINGNAPWLCEVAAADPSTPAFTHVYPEVVESDIPQRALAVNVGFSIELDGLTVSVTVTNHSIQRIECECAWSLDADFVDIQEAQNGKREQNADVEADTHATGVRFAYQHARLHYRSSIEVTTHADWQITSSRIATRIALDPQTSVDLGLRIAASAADGSSLADDDDDRNRELRKWTESFARITAARNRTAELIVAKNIRDFASFPLLEGERDEWLALQAGMPLYPALFGRDTLTAGWQAAWVDCPRVRRS